MKNAAKEISKTDSIHQQYWATVTDEERANWDMDEANAIYDWVRENLANAAKNALIDVEVNDAATIVTALSIDCPFIIDSLTALVQRRGYSIIGLIHPVLRDASFAVDMSVVSIRLRESLSDQEAAQLALELDQVMQDVLLATQDWQDLRAKMGDLVNLAGLQPQEKAFLDYLRSNNFTFLGYASTPGKALEPQEGLGVLSPDRKLPLLQTSALPLPLPTCAHSNEKERVIVFKLPLISTVHRPVRYDAIIVRECDKKGAVTREHIFIGLFTSVTYSRSIKDVPLLREKAEAVIETDHLLPDHHDFKAMTHILEKYPRDELFRIDLPTLIDFTHGIMRLQERQRIALFARADALTNTICALVYIPRERFETRLRLQIQHIIEEEYHAESEGFTVSMDDSPLVRVLFSLRAKNGVPLNVSAADVESKILSRTRSWNEQVREILPRETAARFGDMFPLSYQTNYGVSMLQTDVDHIEKLLSSGQLQVELYRPEGVPQDHMRFKIYALNEAVPLSDALPILENFGFRVISETPIEIHCAAPQCSIWIHDFYVCAKDKATAYDIDTLRPVFEDTFIAIWRGSAANDTLNRLTARAGMAVRDVMTLRAYTGYFHQIRSGYSPAYVHTTLGDNPILAGLLVQLFHARFDPALTPKQRASQSAKINAQINEELTLVTSLDQDTIIRRLHNLIEATLRTNAYQRGDDGQLKEYISFKIDCALVTKMPEPRPLYEVFVFSARMEGVHLRGGKVARGGIRWSDRPDDFRTEILGLVKAQVVKNAVIVPTGAKGGFILKNPPALTDRQAYAKEGVECYKILIRGLLDITDNQIAGKTVPPENVVRYDNDDTYLAVAADKGTATFSDIANALSVEYGFWFDDAFASGGSAGYDHKVMGITAKGVWECVKRHFRERGKNIQSEEFTVIGVGDMAGDVFGNGMLLSAHIKLIGAFNHRHIFCDPLPNAAKSFTERTRLFKNVLGWDQYNLDVLSPGGRIFERSAKSLTLTPEIKTAFGIEADDVSPDDLIRALLKAPVELLYFGGIGTYIKAESESHADVSDRANDNLRVDTCDVRAHVIGEGANLAITQNARIALDRQGTHLNTDFIDNSAGVDCSDHEVNIKILFSQLMQQKGMVTRPARDIMLRDMTDAVAALVLHDNYQQSQAISSIKMFAPSLLPLHMMTMERLEGEYGLKRAVENLPSNKEMLERQAVGQGLTRPEIAVILSYAKMALKKDIIASDIPDRPDMNIWLETYFPETIRTQFREALLRHPLRRDIIATQIANSAINRMGPHFIFEKQAQTGLSATSIIDAYLLGRDVLNLHPLWHSIECLDNQIETSVQMRLLEKTSRILDRLVRRFLNIYGEKLRASISGTQLREQLNEVMPSLYDLLSDNLRSNYHQRMSQLREQKVVRGIAEAVTLLPYAVMAIEALQLAVKPAQRDNAIKTYFAVGARFHSEPLRQQARYLAAEQPENAPAINSLIDSLMTAQTGLAGQVLNVKGADEKTRLAAWVKDHDESVSAIDRLLEGITEGRILDLGRLVLIEQKIRHLAQRG